MAAERNSDGTVTMKTRGTLAYTPSAGSSVGRAFVKPGAPGGLAGTGVGGRMVRQKGAGYSGKSAYK